MTKPDRQPLSWDPVRQGARFCAPACGRGCTHAEWRAATAAADKLCADLGAGWVPDVWENLGWHYSAISACGRWKVHGHSSGYTAFLGEAGCSGGRWAESGVTPQAAIRATWAAARQEIDKLATYLTAAPVDA